MPTSRELVYQALEFRNPERIPRDIWILPWATIHYSMDVQRILEKFPPDFTGAPGIGYLSKVQGDPYAVGTYIDEWGCIFENYQAGVIGEVKTPAVATWEDLPKLRIPWERLNFDRSAVKEACKDTTKFIMCGCCPRPFERLQFIRTSAQAFMDLAEQPPELFELLHTLHEFYLKELEAWAQTDVDGLSFMDDWGAQSRLLISPKLWRKIFKPMYKEYIDLAHHYGKKIFMHSDGYIADVIPDLVELGLDALNSQLFCMNIEAIGQQARGKITFWGEIDRQQLLSFGTPDDIDTAVRRVYQNLYANGGVIGQCEFSVGSRPENVYQVYEAWEQMP